MKILFFSSVAEISGCNEIELPGCDSINSLKELLEARFPGLKDSRYTFAVNRQIIHDNHQLKEDDSVALLPPFSGG